MSKFDEPAPMEWIYPARRGYKLACCDCGLVHDMDFSLDRDAIGRARIKLRGDRNERSTALTRRQNDYTCKPKQ